MVHYVPETVVNALRASVRNMLKPRHFMKVSGGNGLWKEILLESGLNLMQLTAATESQYHWTNILKECRVTLHSTQYANYNHHLVWVVFYFDPNTTSTG